jgi:hypothetical protein
MGSLGISASDLNIPKNSGFSYTAIGTKTKVTHDYAKLRRVGMKDNTGTSPEKPLEKPQVPDPRYGLLFTRR